MSNENLLDKRTQDLLKKLESKSRHKKEVPLEFLKKKVALYVKAGYLDSEVVEKLKDYDLSEYEMEKELHRMRTEKKARKIRIRLNPFFILALAVIIVLSFFAGSFFYGTQYSTNVCSTSSFVVSVEGDLDFRVRVQDAFNFLQGKDCANFLLISDNIKLIKFGSRQNFTVDENEFVFTSSRDALTRHQIIGETVSASCLIKAMKEEKEIDLTQNSLCYSRGVKAMLNTETPSYELTFFIEKNPKEFFYDISKAVSDYLEEQHVNGNPLN
ncbi:MAG TPA: hypothetical protein VJK05_03010 [archaeon]|nr:hypothetical protein [archaeon]